MGSQKGATNSQGGKNSNATRNTETMASVNPAALEFKRVKYGDIVRGVVALVHPNEVLIDIGAKTEAALAQRETEQLARKGFSDLPAGGEILVFVLVGDESEGNVIVSLEKAQAERDWLDAERLMQEQTTVEAQVVAYNKGGVIAALGQVRGFVPASQLEVAARRSNELVEDDLKDLVGKNLKFKIIEIDRARNRLILSERLAMREVRRGQKDRFFDELREGEIRTGTVASIADFGVFVDLGLGIEGLVHISELSWTKTGHPRDLVKVGDQVPVQVLGVDRDKNRVALSMKRLMPEPWSTVEDRYQVGQLVNGTITKLAPFGAFARVDDLEGLIHISELADRRVNHPKEVVKEGDVLTLRVIKVEPARRRLGLSLKQVSDPLIEYPTYEDALTDEPSSSEESEMNVKENHSEGVAG